MNLDKNVLTANEIKRAESKLVWNIVGNPVKGIIGWGIFALSVVLSTIGFAMIGENLFNEPQIGAGFGFVLIIVLESIKSLSLAGGFKKLIKNDLDEKTGMIPFTLFFVISGLIIIILWGLDTYSSNTIAHLALKKNTKKAKNESNEYQKKLQKLKNNNTTKTNLETKADKLENELQKEYETYKDKITEYHNDRNEYSQIAPKLKKWKNETNKERYDEIKNLRKKANSLATTVSAKFEKKFKKEIEKKFKIIEIIIWVLSAIIFAFFQFLTIKKQLDKYFEFKNRDDTETIIHKDYIEEYKQLKSDWEKSLLDQTKSYNTNLKAKQGILNSIKSNIFTNDTTKYRKKSDIFDKESKDIIDTEIVRYKGLAEHRVDNSKILAYNELLMLNRIDEKTKLIPNEAIQNSLYPPNHNLSSKKTPNEFLLKECFEKFYKQFPFMYGKITVAFDSSLKVDGKAIHDKNKNMIKIIFGDIFNLEDRDDVSKYHNITRHCIYHELGHALSFMLFDGDIPTSLINIFENKDIENDISKIANVDIEEMIAESIAEYFEMGKNSGAGFLVMMKIFKFIKNGHSEPKMPNIQEPEQKEYELEDFFEDVFNKPNMASGRILTTNKWLEYPDFTKKLVDLKIIENFENEKTYRAKCTYETALIRIKEKIK